MYYSQNISTQSFHGLDYSNVSTADRKYVRKCLPELRTLGRLYDIKLTSTYANVPDMAAIDIDVRPLKNGLNILRRLFRPTGKNTFSIHSLHNEGSDFIKAVETAIIDLGKKIRK